MKKQMQKTRLFYSVLLIVIIAGIIFGFLLRIRITGVSRKPHISRRVTGIFPVLQMTTA